MTWTRLDFRPEPPLGLGATGPASLNALGAVLKILGAFLGKQTEPPVILRGFWGAALHDGADGVEVKSVLAQGPAASAGLQQGDCITKVGGQGVKDVADIRKLADKKVGEQALELTVIRKGESRKVNLMLGKGL
jgi:S1-C subfamily serine protease